MKRVAVRFVLAVPAVLLLSGCPSGGGPGGGPVPVEDVGTSDLPSADTEGPLPCQDDSDCAGRWCDPFSGVCVDCVNDSHCGEGMICDKWVCVPVTECEEDGGCPEGQVCDPDAGICVECLEDIHCPEGMVCLDGDCLFSCLDGSPCPEGTVCDPDLDACVECLSDADCGEPEWCNVEKKECYPDVCAAGDFSCSGNAVIQCAANGAGWSAPVPCPRDTTCVDGLCVEGLLCVPGLSTCKDLTTVERCSADGMTLTEIPCPEGTSCLDGECTEECVPDCFDKECGPSGCPGYSCGSCPEGMFCQDFGCVGGECLPGETTCQWGMVLTCVAGDDGLGHWGPPEPCPPGTGCEDGECVGVCVPACDGKSCGSDGCGGSCGQCPPGEECTPGGLCIGPDCKPGETLCDGSVLLICTDDGGWETMPCPPGTTCSNGKCQPACVPSCTNKDCGPDGCGGSCGVCPAGASCNEGGICVNACQPDCAGKECGSNGCGGLCGVCDPDEACVDEACVKSYTCVELQQCYWQCGWSDSCYGQCWADSSIAAQMQWIATMQCVTSVCGEEPSEACWQGAIGAGGQCQDEWSACQNCTPECEGLQCGPDGCGGKCGQCPGGFVCDSYGYCLCAPQCQNKQCGPDGCGGQCGFCAVGSVCNYLGKCVCMPQCQGKQCGSDGCGGTCGQCPDGLLCVEGFCLDDACAAGEIPDCDGVCAPESWIGDGFCDQAGSGFGVNFYCEEYGWDGGDCEESNCGNQYCQPDFGETCETCPEDCGPCQPECPPGKVMDCNGTCRNQSLLGNGICNEGQGGGPMGGPNFNCAQWEWDYGDCGTGPGCGDGWCDYWSGESCEWCPEDCGPCGGEGDCCTAHDSPGCEDPDVMACVCALDSFCCENYWDEICVGEATEQCGAWCEEPGCDEICAGFECGQWENCWCGDCPDGSQCQQGKCTPVDPICDFICQMYECGSMGQCWCGECAWGETCVNGSCVAQNECEEICWGKQCGTFQGCNCGTCPPDAVCSANGTCTPVQPGLSCQQLVQCALGCGYTADCIYSCYNQGSATGKSQFQSLSLCVLQACGTPTPDCLMGAINGPCAQQYAACK